MKSTKPSRHVKASHRHLKLKSHHARPFRKRHIGVLALSILAFVFLVTVLISYRDQIISGIASSKSFVSDLFLQNKSPGTTVVSSRGFTLTYDQQQFYASAINSADGNLYSGNELAKERAYSVVKVVPSGLGDAQTGSSLTVTTRSTKLGAKETLDSVALKDGGLDANNLSKVLAETVTIGGQVFEKTTWQSKAANALAPSLSAKFVTYAASVKGSVVTIVASLGVGDGKDLIYRPIINSISFEITLSAAPSQSEKVVAKTQASRSILDMVMNTNVAAAVAGADLTGSEKVAALYSPAVVKLYNAYCMDIFIDNKPYLDDACSSAAGSGFFVSQDGYIGTNGHVASTTPIDVVIADAITTYSSKGDPKYFNYLLGLTKLTQADIPDEATTSQKVAIMVDAMYTIDTARITTKNAVQNLLVQVTAKNPDIAALLQATKDRVSYTGDKSLLAAKLVAADYKATDGYDGFRASDVAIIKVPGKNFPIVKLGGFDSVRQGADLSIIGYPSNASDNGLVDTSSSEATLTTGKVSAKKNAANSDKKLIETDTTIGHGNSGGPALDNDGEVVGIATYTADGSGEGNGVFNYIRDIKDLKDLASDNDIVFDTNSATQTEWTKGIADFYTAHYSKALQSFNKVQELYPNNSRVAEFIAAAEKRVANGEDVSDFPLTTVIVVSVVGFVGATTGLILVIRHHRRHKIYKAGVAQGSVIPRSGAKTQTVFVSHGTVRVDSPLPLAHAPRGSAEHPDAGHEA